MFKTILVPIDTSHAEVGTAALTLAGDTAKVRSGKIVVLNMVETIARRALPGLPTGPPGPIPRQAKRLGPPAKRSRLAPSLTQDHIAQDSASGGRP